ncbi:hypothetical protein PO329_26250, partial [Escherichia coli]
LAIPDILCQAHVDVIHKRFQLNHFVAGLSEYITEQKLMVTIELEQTDLLQNVKYDNKEKIIVVFFIKNNGILLRYSHMIGGCYGVDF